MGLPYQTIYAEDQIRKSYGSPGISVVEEIYGGEKVNAGRRPVWVCPNGVSGYLRYLQWAKKPIRNNRRGKVFSPCRLSCPGINQPEIIGSGRQAESYLPGLRQIKGLVLRPLQANQDLLVQAAIDDHKRFAWFKGALIQSIILPGGNTIQGEAGNGGYGYWCICKSGLCGLCQEPVNK